MLNLYKIYKEISALGVLGMNARNAEYILKYNKRCYYPMVDDKLQTKKLALENHIRVPQLLGVVKYQSQLAALPRFLMKHNDFVIKPARGSGGDGISVFSGRRMNAFCKVNGDLVDDEEVVYHTANILAGMYSLGSLPDVALIEQRLEFDSCFQRVTYLGVPDIRVIVFRGIPVMSMLRLPTQQSDGKANLHQGAIGAGVDIASGVTTSAVWRNQPVEIHPATGHSVIGVEIPHWHRVLDLAAQCGEIVKLGYIGVDIVLDRTMGPVLLEMNARPGLNIQIANRIPLGPRLHLLESLNNIETMSRQDKIDFACAHFSATTDSDDSIGEGWFCDTISEVYTHDKKSNIS